MTELRYLDRQPDREVAGVGDKIDFSASVKTTSSDDES